MVKSVVNFGANPLLGRRFGVNLEDFSRNYEGFHAFQNKTPNVLTETKRKRDSPQNDWS